MADSRPSSGEPNWARLERALGVRFKERSLLRQAVVHRSFLNENAEPGLESYDRLEYLGDAFLGWVVAGELHRRYPTYSEGDLTRARAEMVRGETLAVLAQRLDLGAYLFMGQGEEASGGRTRRSTLAAALEAVLAAVMLDRGERSARALVLRWLGPAMELLPEAGPPRDAKSALQEVAQSRGLPLPTYAVLEDRGPGHERRFRVAVSVAGRALAEGEGRRKAQAEQQAAAAAMPRLDAG